MSDNQLLYHYTNIAGLNGIIQSCKIWASDCRYLNDRQELVKALDLFLSKFEGPKREALSNAFQWHSFSRCHCVFSLSRSPQVLSQWRTYADDGRGAAIGFKAEFLSPKGINNPASFLVHCVYEDHDGFIDGLTKRCEQEVEELTKMHQEAVTINTFWGLIDKNPRPLETLYSELLRIKNPAFLEEQEARLVINVSANQVQTRVANGLIIPYIAHAFLDKDKSSWRSFIAPEIWLGPKCDDRNMHALQVYRQPEWSPNMGLRKYDCGYL